MEENHKKAPVEEFTKFRRQSLRSCLKTRPFRDLKGFLMRVRVNRRKSYAKLHMIKEVEVKDHKNLSKIEGMVLRQLLRGWCKIPPIDGLRDFPGASFLNFRIGS